MEDIDKLFKEKLSTNPIPKYQQSAAEENWFRYNKLYFKSKYTVLKYLGIAASISIVIAIGVLLLSEDKTINNNEPFLMELKTNDIISSQIMPDSTELWINKYSSVKFQEDKSYRKIDLMGEAFFKVHRNEKKKFQVKCGKATIEVLGTEFNVKKKHDQQKVIVTVYAGRVTICVGSESLADSLILYSDEQAIVDEKSLKISKKRISGYSDFDWIENRLSFKNELVEEVINKIAKHYQKVIILQSVELSRKKVTIVFDNQPFSEVINDLAILLNCELKINNEQYSLLSK